MNHASRSEAYSAALGRFNAWVEANREPDGRWRGPSEAGGYFSFVAYANEIGRRDWAAAALRCVREDFVNPDGSLQQGPNRAGMLPYVPAWLAWGAHRAEAFELSAGLLDQICAYQCLRSGGFFGSAEARAANNGEIDFDSTTISIIALAQCGRAQAAARAADLLLRMYKEQPALHEGFRTAWCEPDGPLADDQAGPTSVLRWSEPAQHYYKVGLFTLALCYAYGATGTRQYLDAARQLHDLTVARAADLWTNTISHKMCWAATCLYSTTGEPEYLEHACRFADHLVAVQHQDGPFTYPELWPDFPPDNWELLPNAGAQFALWIARTLSRMR